MPALKLFGRRWSIASDDFVFPCLSEAFIRLTYFVTSICIFVMHSKAQCEAGWYLRLYIAGQMVLNLLVVLHSFGVAYISSLGTMLNPIRRRQMPALFYSRCPLMVFEVAWNIAGSVWSASATAACDRVFLLFVRTSLVVSWLITFLTLFGLWLLFDPLGNIHHDDFNLVLQNKRIWQTRLRTIFCCIGANSDRLKVALEDTAELLSFLFCDKDLVFTDLWAGIILLASKQVRIMQTCQMRPPPAGRVPDWMNLRLASRVMDFALGVYGWPYYICTTNCCCGCDRLWSLLRRLRCCYTCRCDRVLIIKDNCCLCNTTALLLQTRIDETDLFYVSFHDEVWETPFVACIDHASRNIVVAIRGSMSLHDAITDLCISEDCLQLPSELCASSPPGVVDSDNRQRADDASKDVPNGSTDSGFHKYFVHKGFLRTARYIYTKLKDEHILDDLFVLQPDYGLVITGHSLGAGVASVVSMLLRPSYPKVMCFAFSPPGCVVSDNAVAYTREFVFSIICGDDLVPRLSVRSLQRLKASVLEALEQCSKPKYQILLKGLFRYFIESKSSNVHQLSDEEAAVVYSQPPTQTDPLMMPTPGHRSLAYTNEQLESSYEIVRHKKLRCPGRILHITQQKGGDEEATDGGGYGLTWCDQSHFDEIKLSGSMINDHMPYFVSNVLRNLANSPSGFSSA